MANIDEIGKKIEDTLDDIKELPGQLELFSAQQSFALFMERTFTTGGVKDIKGNSLKPYTAAYKKVRENNKPSLQTDNKDLQFTGKLFRSINVGLSIGKPAMGITNEDSSKIAGYQEEQNNTKIFQLNDAERERVIDDTKSYMFEKLRNIVSQWQ